MPRAPVRRITRFTVMATLQAARASRLGLPERSAFSWGLNRAIFYAAAKRGFSGAGGPPKTGEPATAPPPETTYALGDDFAYRDPSRSELYFTIGGETQTEKEFERQVAVRFGSEKHFREAWKEALALVDGFEDEVLRSGSRFYSVVYRPRRDELVEEWTERYLKGPAGEGPDNRPRARSGDVK
jgi:hypothetical protein